MKWSIEFTGKAKKQIDRLPAKVKEILFQLVRKIETAGQIRGVFLEQLISEARDEKGVWTMIGSLANHLLEHLRHRQLYSRTQRRQA